jgi:hypothetical protein
VRGSSVEARADHFEKGVPEHLGVSNCNAGVVD